MRWQRAAFRGSEERLYQAVSSSDIDEMSVSPRGGQVGATGSRWGCSAGAGQSSFGAAKLAMGREVAATPHFER
jgi:hypothetical protein